MATWFTSSAVMYVDIPRLEFDGLNRARTRTLKRLTISGESVPNDEESAVRPLLRAAAKQINSLTVT